MSKHHLTREQLEVRLSEVERERDEAREGREIQHIQTDRLAAQREAALAKLDAAGAREKALLETVADAEVALTQMMNAVMVFHGEAGWALYSNGAPEWKRAKVALEKIRAAIAKAERRQP